MKRSQPTLQIERLLIGALAAIATIGSSAALARDDHGHGVTMQHQAPDHARRTGEFVKLVREATRRFHDPAVALAEGYAPQFGCVSGSDEGAMGVHFVNGALVSDGELDPTRPELLVYEPMPNGRLRLIGADYLVFVDAWHATNTATPELMGQLFHLFDSPNRFGLPAFYTLHVWAWKKNPHGAFVNWHPQVTCEHVEPQS
jgi:hypothetical protein